MKEVTVSFENSVTRIPGAEKYLTPTFYEIPLITTAQNKIVTIDIQGVRLNNKNNYIVFKGKQIPTTSVSSKKNVIFYSIDRK